jgi:hypothetical protein
LTLNASNSYGIAASDDLRKVFGRLQKGIFRKKLDIEWIEILPISSSVNSGQNGRHDRDPGSLAKELSSCSSPRSVNGFVLLPAIDYSEEFLQMDSSAGTQLLATLYSTWSVITGCQVESSA